MSHLYCYSNYDKMKRLLLLFLISLSIATYAQPPKNSTKIVIKNVLTAKENYDLVSKTLLANDFFIESKDMDLFYLKTQSKPVNKWTGVYFLNIIASDNQIQISGMMKSGQEINISGVVVKSEFEPIAFKGMNMSLYKEAFKVMDAFASKFEGTKEYK